jgi:hypothetical protein
MIKVADTDLSDMRQFYEEELNKTVRRLKHIKSVLDQLGGSGHSIEIQVSSTLPNTQHSTSRGPGRPPKNGVTRISDTAVAKTKRHKKRGRKSLWETIILKRMQQLNKPLTYDELTEEVMSLSRLPESKRVSTKQAVINVTFRLRNRDKKLDTFSMGSREKYLGLSPWFEKTGEIKPEYASKIAAQKTAITYKPKAAKHAKATAKVAGKRSAPKAGKVGRPKATAETSTIAASNGTAKAVSKAKSIKRKAKSKTTSTASKLAAKPVAKKKAPKATSKIKVKGKVAVKKSESKSAAKKTLAPVA